jgi:hypothetical protein
MSGDEEDAESSVWDQKAADAAIGKIALVGVTYLAADGVTVTRTVQIFGEIVEADERSGVVIKRQGDGDRVTLPPDMSLFTPGTPGEYRLRTTGETVVDPDFVSQWTVTEPVKH